MKQNCNCNDIKVETPFCININGDGGGSNIIVVSELPDASAAMPNQLYLNKSNNVMFITYDNAVWTTLSATWGYIFGNLLAQTDLIDYINTNVVAHFQQYVEMITESLDAINSELSIHTGQFIDVDNKLTQINGDITTVNGRIDGLNTDISSILAQIDTIDTKIETIDGEISVINVNISNINDRITSIDNSINAILGNIDAINTDMGTIRDSITALSDSTDMRFANVSNQLNTTIENLSDLGAIVTSNIQRIYDIETKLATIETGAEVNVQSDWTLTDSNSDAYIKNKPANFPTIWSMIGGNISDQSDLQTALTELQTNINLNHSLIGTAIVTRVLEDTSNLDTTRLNVRTRNVNTGTETVRQLDLALANDTKSGIMPSESFRQIETNTQAIATLQNVGRRYPTTQALPDNMSQQDLTDLYHNISGTTGDPHDNDTLVSIHQDTNNYQWTYFTATNSWVFRGVTSVNIATNSTAGIVKGHNEAGKVFVEQDGTMSLVGYDEIISNDNQMQGDISNLQSQVSTNTTDITSIRTEQTTQNNRLNALDTKINQTNTDVSNLSARVTSNEGLIANKLDKVTTGAGTQLYTKNADGTQGMTNLASSVTGNSIPLRSAAGTVRTGDPIDVTDSVNLRYLQQYYPSTSSLQSLIANKLDKITTESTYNQVYAKTPAGGQTMFQLDSAATANTIPLRGFNGEVKVGNPNVGADAINLGYIVSYYTTTSTLNSLLANKVDKVAGKDLSTNDYTTAEKEKLAGLVNYVHPAGSALSTGMYRITTNNTGHIIGAIAVTKQDIVNLGIPAQDTVTTSSIVGTGNAVTDITHQNGQIIATKGANFLTTDKIQLVTQLPANPDPTVLYLIPE